MNSSKILFVVALIAISCITFTHSIKCYSCNTVSSCKKAKKLDCNYALANTTRAYLDFHHTGVNPNVTSSILECFQETIKSNAGEFSYKGCSYNNIRGCELPLRTIHSAGQSKHGCNQCNNKDGCNPAGRINTDVFAVFATVIVVLFGRSILV